jgi:hypothetical protein
MNATASPRLDRAGRILVRLVLTSAMGDRYRVRVSDDGSIVGLWRR